ncbi:flavin reductase family protein [Sediminicoccus sp. KRV36]|uniref:flavin reductase family protein n=1 Tax=Sediminicoccus sp. KRV36 TaxID=3133721 RepID=UPI00200EAE0B|nr:flavin reductase family protein [Sediminicoccus rosea]UPY35957.1 flavin reductase family protein [Sediminicoccus rosea]
MPIESKEFRNAMARLPAAVNIVTTDGPAGLGGFTASAVCSVTDSPATLLVCMNRSVSSCEAFRANGVLAVNTLCGSQQELSGIFAGFTGVDGPARFEAGNWGKLVTGAPVLEGALVSFDARITDLIEKGTHLVLFAEIEAIRLDEGVDEALLYFARDYRRVLAA